jgi:septum formation protein
MKHQIILASGSPRRLELLQQIGINPIVIKSRVEEQITQTNPALVVEELSRQKSIDVAAHLEEYLIENSLTDMTAGLSETNIDPVPVFNASQALVLGADTVVACDGNILGKPHSHDEAFRMIQLLQGRSHQVFTGVTLVIPGADISSSTIITFHEKTEVHVAAMSEPEIRAYAESSEPMDKAGAYGIQGSFGKFIDRIEGDYYNVVGLPLARVYAAIRKLEV